MRTRGRLRYLDAVARVPAGVRVDDVQPVAREGRHDAVGEGEEVAASAYARELEEMQFQLLARSEAHQEQVLSKVVERAEREGQRQIEGAGFYVSENEEED